MWMNVIAFTLCFLVVVSMFAYTVEGYDYGPGRTKKRAKVRRFWQILLRCR